MQKSLAVGSDKTGGHLVADCKQKFESSKWRCAWLSVLKKKTNFRFKTSRGLPSLQFTPPPHFLHQGTVAPPPTTTINQTTMEEPPQCDSNRKKEPEGEVAAVLNLGEGAAVRRQKNGSNRVRVMPHKYFFLSPFSPGGHTSGTNTGEMGREQPASSSAPRQCNIVVEETHLRRSLHLLWRRVQKPRPPEKLQEI